MIMTSHRGVCREKNCLVKSVVHYSQQAGPKPPLTYEEERSLPRAINICSLKLYHSIASPNAHESQARRPISAMQGVQNARSQC